MFSEPLTSSVKEEANRKLTQVHCYGVKNKLKFAPSKTGSMLTKKFKYSVVYMNADASDEETHSEYANKPVAETRMTGKSGGDTALEMKALLFLPLLAVLAAGSAIERKTSGNADWWESTIFYQIYPRSFADSDGDGIGDLNGITSKLKYIKELGVGAIWLSPMFQSPMYDFGYDISDFYAVHDEYGTMDDFENLMKRAEELGIKVVLDLVPNHTSNESVWFQEALKGNQKYYDYFVWEDGVLDDEGNMHPPNNWLSRFRKSAWEYREEVGKYYLHQFVIGQPDLNYRNPDVVEEMKGVAGFRVDAINHLFEVDKELFGGKYPDEPRSGNVDVDPEDHDYLDHIYIKNQNETYYMVYDWRDVLDEYKARDGLTRVMMTEVYATIQEVVRYFGEGDRIGAHMPFNFDLITDVDASSSANDIKYTIDRFLSYKPLDEHANWVVGNHDNSRMATRYGSALVDGINMIVLLLPGIGVTYMVPAGSGAAARSLIVNLFTRLWTRYRYLIQKPRAWQPRASITPDVGRDGEEIGMVDGYVSWEDTVDPSGCNTDDPVNYWKASRDPERTPFQWSSEKNAGFSTADKTWLPVAEGYETLNVEYQKKADRSHYHVYRSLAKLRQDKVFRLGKYESLALNSDVFAFQRWYQGEAYVMVVNLRDTENTVDLTYLQNVYGKSKIVITSVQSPKNKGIKVLVKRNQTSPNSMGLRRLITEFLWPPSSSIIRPWLPYSIKVLVKTNQTSPNSMGLRRLITEFLWPPSSSIIRR
ncbi:Maltase A1 [Eumeta japonica]|uniref:alpha-glucosidase n=1 Tax=Eumeta variegata TaxID=151549 RepID=A0A4C1UNA6_EUMVA|nr:Maltase A1 [Eumeta japonica]